MNQGFNVIRASSIPTVSLDCDLSTGNKIGGGTATDNTAALNAVLATASATNPIKLILDGPSLVTGLVIATAGHTCIEGIGWDSGIFIKSGSNADPLNNGKVLPFDGGTQPSPSGSNVILSNFKINGNRGNGTTGNSTSGNPRGVSGTWWYCNINIVNIVGVRIENMYLYDAPAYSIRLNGCSDVVVARNTIINPNATAGPNNDCIHLDGPGSDVRIVGNFLNNNNSDDAIAINSPEGYGGTIDRVAVIGNTFQNTSTAMRVYGTVDGEVPRVVFSDNDGTVGSAVLFLGVANAASTNDLSFRNLVAVGNIFSTGQCLIRVEGGGGDIVLSDWVWQSPTASNSWFQCDVASTLSGVTLNNCRIYRTTAGNNTGSSLVSATAALTIKRLTINGFYVVNEQGQSYAAIANALAMTNVTITSLYVAALDYTNITALADSYANIGSLAGPGYPNKQVIAANKTGAYTVIQTDAYLRGDATTATFAFTLPAAPYLYEEHEFVKVDSSANAVTIAGNGKTINGNASLGTQWAHAKLRYNGASWDSL